jgi:plastocyanin
MRLRAKITVCLAVLTGLGLASRADAVVHNVDVGNFFFDPVITVASVGDTVRWTFVSGLHSSTSDGTSSKDWDSGVRSSGTFQITIQALDGPGPFPYHCSLHPEMTGVIQVAADNDSDDDGVPDASDNCPFVANPTQTDNDMDNFGAACDCDDTDNLIYPGAVEIPSDGIDQDCNGADAAICFMDSDMDGFGSTMMMVAPDGTCDMMQGESDVPSDCDDGNDQIYPGAAEVANDGIDQDCDGSDLIGSCCVVRVGDANGQGVYPDEITLGDIMLLVDVKFVSGDCGKLPCVPEADVNQDGGANPTCEDNVSLGDIMVLVDFLFITGPDVAVLNPCL